MFWMIAEHLLGVGGLRTLDKKSPFKFERNIGKEDRLRRAIIGSISLIALIFVRKGFLLRYVLGLAALAGLVTAYTKFSPVYALIGENTAKKGKKKNK
ncbi:DUF2892 domain-containing protein [Methanolapillus millepedarum]|uniref:Inner membrane protein YgaP-like transmembrane domain-containing protein n=1 Tax=Methanolapillus millepedarum TaxID=3028296 RepID=A0AA96V346_9EURY|nr:hypothetical protein MsAc7_12470 [Methanosarcinaceae archaeon Ac7]